MSDSNDTIPANCTGDRPAQGLRLGSRFTWYRLCNLIAVISLVVSLATSALFIRGWYMRETVRGLYVWHKGIQTVATIDVIHLDLINDSGHLIVILFRQCLAVTPTVNAQLKSGTGFLAPGFHFLHHAQKTGSTIQETYEGQGLRGVLFGFFATHSTSSPQPGAISEAYLIKFPAWVVLLILVGVACAAHFIAKPAHRRYRIAHGLCGACGYDLRGSMGAASCPECGTTRA